MLSSLNFDFSEIEKWQTLITGGLAILAAWIAARPVWRQLARMETQSNVMLREVYLRRIVEIEGRQTAARNALRDCLESINRDLSWWDDTDQIDEHWAFDKWQRACTAMDRFLHFQSTFLDEQGLEGLKQGVVQRLEALSECLNDIHVPASTEQHDEDHDIPDDEWAKIEERGKAARAEVPANYTATLTALGALEAAYSKQIESIKAKLVEIDRALVA